MLRKSIFLFIILLTAAISVAQEQKPGYPLVITLRNDLPPLSFLNVDGQPAGFFVDMWKLWAEKTGQNIRFHLAPWKDTLESLKKGKADIHGGLYYSEERAQWIAFSQPVYEFGMCVFFPKNKKKIHHIKELKGHKIGITGGTAPEQYLHRKYPELEFVPFTGVKDMITSARKGTIRAFVSTPASVSAILGRLGLADEFESTDENLFAQKLQAGVLKHNTELLNLVNSGFDDISDRELAEIEARWIQDTEKRYYASKISRIKLTPEEEEWIKAHPSVNL